MISGGEMREGGDSIDSETDGVVVGGDSYSGGGVEGVNCGMI